MAVRNIAVTDTLEKFRTEFNELCAQDFGDMCSVCYTYATASSKVRGFCAGGSTPHADVIDFITFSSTGNATDTGNLTQARYQ